MKKLLILAMLTLLPFVLSGCNDGNGKAEATSKKEAPVSTEKTQQQTSTAKDTTKTPNKKCAADGKCGQGKCGSSAPKP